MVVSNDDRKVTRLLIL